MSSALSGSHRVSDKVHARATVPDSRPWQEFWAHRVQGTHSRSTMAKAQGGQAGKEAAMIRPPGTRPGSMRSRPTQPRREWLLISDGQRRIAPGSSA